jgi:UDP-N-acetylglucosamine transferase subunit ALG13
MMIFVLLGTQDSPFLRILKETEKAIKELDLKEKVYAQVGETVFSSKLIKTKAYFTSEEYENLMDKARVIITHGGAGILFQAIHLEKKIIAMPRKMQLGEHNDNHQNELVKKLSELGYIYEAKSSIKKALLDINAFQPKPYALKNDILNTVRKFIEEEV